MTRPRVFRMPFLPGDTSPWLVLWNEGEEALLQSFRTFPEAFDAAHQLAVEKLPVPLRVVTP